MAFLLTFSGGGSATYKDAVRVASTANLALSGSTPLTIDGVTLADKERVLLKDQSTGSQNGIYEVSISGGSYSLARAKDADTDKEVLPGMLVPVAEGSTHADKIFQLLTNAPIVVGTTALVFSDVLIGLANKADRDLQNLTLAGTTEQVLALGAGNSPYWATEGVKTGYPANTVIVGKAKPAGLTGTGNTIIGTGTTANALTTATDSIFIGTNNASNLTTNSSNVIIGNNVTFDLNSSGSHRSIAIGNSVKVLGSTFTRDAVAIGHQAEVNPDSVSIGFQAKGPGAYAVAIGYQAESKGSYSVALGYRAKADGDSCVLGGDTTSNGQSSSLVVGTYAAAGGPRSVSIGTGQTFERTSAGTEGIAIGHGAQALANTLGIGSEGAKINTVYIGRGTDTHWLNVPIVTGHPVKIMTMRGTGVDSDISAGTLTLAGSQSTGNAAGGDVIIATAPAGASGSTLNAHVERVRVTAAGSTQFSGSVLAVDGTAAAPAYSFTSDSDLGLYRNAANELGIAATAGVLIPATASTAGKLTIGTAGVGGGGTLDLKAGNWNHATLLMAGNTVAFSNGGTVELVGGSFRFGNDGQLNFPNRNIWLGTLGGGGDGGTFGKNFRLNGATQFFYWGRYNQIHAGKRLSVGAPFANTETLGGTLSARGEADANVGLTFTGPTSTLSITGTSQHQTFFQNVGVGDYVYLNGLGGTIRRVTAVTWDTNPYYTGTSTVTLDGTIGDATSRAIIVEKPIVQLRNSSGTIVQELRNNDTLRLNSGLSIKSLHAQAGTADVITVSVSDYYVGVDCSLAAKTVNLPAAATAGAGKTFVIKDETGSAATNNITIDANGAELIDGAATYVMAVNRESVTLVCDGTGWQII